MQGLEGKAQLLSSRCWSALHGTSCCKAATAALCLLMVLLQFACLLHHNGGALVLPSTAARLHDVAAAALGGWPM